MGEKHQGFCQRCSSEAQVTYTNGWIYGEYLCDPCLEREGEEIVAGIPFTD